jgi:hypothetical protein
LSFRSHLQKTSLHQKLNSKYVDLSSEICVLCMSMFNIAMNTFCKIYLVYCKLAVHQWRVLCASFYISSHFPTGNEHSFPGTEADHSLQYIAQITVNLMHPKHLALGYLCLNIYGIRYIGKCHKTSQNIVFLSNSAFMEETSSINLQTGSYLEYVYCFTAHFKYVVLYKITLLSGKRIGCSRMCTNQVQCHWHHDLERMQTVSPV